MTSVRGLFGAAVAGTACTVVVAAVSGVPLTAVAAVAAAGAFAAAQTMFITATDFNAFMVVMAAAGTVGVVLAMALGRRVATSSRALELVARAIGRDGADARGGSFAVLAGATGALADLGRELEEMSRRLDEARRQERAVESSRRELVAWVSHDLRTPLAGIRALVEALEDGVVDDPETVARYHRTVREEADRLALLVDDLFELSNLQAGALQLQLERASLTDLVSDAIAASAPVVEGDLAFVSVADAVGGIPDGELPRVFEPASRGESARSPATGGRGGLGLAIVRGIVEAHHGDVDVRNEGEGCRFTVRLPISVDS